MAFVDEARIFVKGGNGGKGCESFYQDKLTRYPRPDGGDGGKGGDVTFVADKNIHTLLDYRFKQHYEGGRGGHGSSKNFKGKSGKDIFLRVPTGTIIRDFETKLLIRDLVEDGESVLIAKGGLQGRGNHDNRRPLPPGIGEAKTIHLELKLIADVGIVGFPNAGKSTLISNISKVKSKIANYHFTTKQPILGVVIHDDNSHFIVADLPGLIEGAHAGKGMGDRFLKHAERTKILLHVIDMAGSEARDPLEDYAKIKKELELYSDKLAEKIRLVVANKMDLPEAEENLKRFKKKYKKEKVISVSAIENKGLDKLVEELWKLLRKAKAEA
ncbi:MAG: GTPase ObgE [Candidatus Omnitrophica bacterium]|nr:GTPase ObgE [Candidatus Omnitrophota bacterium]